MLLALLLQLSVQFLQGLDLFLLAVPGDLGTDAVSLFLELLILLI